MDRPTDPPTHRPTHRHTQPPVLQLTDPAVVADVRKIHIFHDAENCAFGNGQKLNAQQLVERVIVVCADGTPAIRHTNSASIAHRNFASTHTRNPKTEATVKPNHPVN
jgi:hypothetical protein